MHLLVADRVTQINGNTFQLNWLDAGSLQNRAGRLLIND